MWSYRAKLQMLVAFQMGHKGCDRGHKLDPKSNGDPEVISEHGEIVVVAEGRDR